MVKSDAQTNDSNECVLVSESNIYNATMYCLILKQMTLLSWFLLVNKTHIAQPVKSDSHTDDS